MPFIVKTQVTYDKFDMTIQNTVSEYQLRRV